MAGIQIGGQTNLSGGLRRGATCVGQMKSPEHINRAILLTDSQADHGIVDRRSQCDTPWNCAKMESPQ
jgi:Ca-activated chloride channel family protein